MHPTTASYLVRDHIAGLEREASEHRAAQTDTGSERRPGVASRLTTIVRAALGSVRRSVPQAVNRHSPTPICD
jgi:hypothetical protein